MLWQVLAEHLEGFLRSTRTEHSGLPRFVERELYRFLDCGVLSRGFARVHCTECGKDELVAFSCKGRGFCPSCGSRRMADLAAHLVDAVLPYAPVRQWVLSLPYRVRFLLAYDPALCARVRRVLVRAILYWIKARAKHTGAPDGRGGAVCFVQRFDSALRLNVHFHLLVLDGVFVRGADRRLQFAEIDPPTHADLQALIARLSRRLTRIVEAKQDRDPEPSPQAACLAAAVEGRGSRRVATEPDPEPPLRRPGKLAAVSDGFSLHAGVRVSQVARDRLEVLCRYVARPPLVADRLSRTKGGLVLYRLKKKWSDGSTHVVLEPKVFLQRLCALVPRPRIPLVTYHGVLAPAATWRAEVVPTPPEQVREPHPHAAPPPQSPARIRKSPRRPWHPWAELMRRVYRVEVLRCPWCHGQRRLLAFLTNPDVIRKILDWLRLPLEPPPRVQARDSPDVVPAW